MLFWTGGLKVRVIVYAIDFVPWLDVISLWL